MKSWVFVFCWLLCSVTAFAQSKKASPCNEKNTFCWYGPYSDNSGEASASGNRWVSPDKSETPLDWVTAVRCIKSLKVCIFARNMQLLGERTTIVDIFYVTKWGAVQIEARREERGPDLGCSTDSLLLNKMEQAATLVSTPGPAANSKGCLVKPKTVTYSLVQ